MKHASRYCVWCGDASGACRDGFSCERRQDHINLYRARRVQRRLPERLSASEFRELTDALWRARGFDRLAARAELAALGMLSYQQ